MLKQGKQVLEEALSLSPTERAKLVDRLLSSLDALSRQKIDKLWAQEAEYRFDAFKRGEIKAIIEPSIVAVPIIPKKSR